MEFVSLPLFSASDAVPEALAALRAQECSAIVVRNADASWLVFGGALLRAANEGVKTLVDVTEREALPPVVREGPRSFGFIQPDAAGSGSWRSAFGELDAATPYALLSAGTSTATVATHEWSRDDLALPGIYVCDRNAKHTFPTPRIGDGDSCIKCKLAPDGSLGTVRLA